MNSIILIAILIVEIIIIIILIINIIIPRVSHFIGSTECVETADCPSGTYCRDYQCVSGCDTDNRCPPNQKCINYNCASTPPVVEKCYTWAGTQPDGSFPSIVGGNINGSGRLPVLYIPDLGPGVTPTYNDIYFGAVLLDAYPVQFSGINAKGQVLSIKQDNFSKLLYLTVDLNNCLLNDCIDPIPTTDLSKALSFWGNPICISGDNAGIFLPYDSINHRCINALPIDPSPNPPPVDPPYMFVDITVTK